MNFFSKITIKYRIFSIGLGGFLAMIIFGFLAFDGFSKSLKSFNDLKNNEVEFLRLANEVKYNTSQVQQWLTDISATRGAEGFDDGFGEAENYAGLLNENFNALQNLAQKNSYSELLEDISTLRETFSSFYAIGSEMAQKYIDGGHISGNAFMGVFDGAAEKMYGSADELMEMANTDYANEIESFSSMIDSYKYKILISGLILTLLMVIGIFFIVRDITNSLTVNCDLIGGASEQISSASNQISAASHSLAEAATTQAASIEEINATLAQSISVNEQNEQNVNEADKLA